jgi:hypothetical protein
VEVFERVRSRRLDSVDESALQLVLASVLTVLSEWGAVLQLPPVSLPRPVEVYVRVPKTLLKGAFAGLSESRLEGVAPKAPMQLCYLSGSFLQ